MRGRDRGGVYGLAWRWGARWRGHHRYEAWRGGARATGPTGASVAMEALRRQARTGIAIAIAGFVLVFLGFLVR